MRIVEPIIKNLFKKLNDHHVNYVILRNWEGFYEDLLIEGHNDIDILCKNQKDKRKIINVFKAIPSKNNFYFCKYEFTIGDKIINLDIRFAGDGYYCRKWELQMLKTRILDERGFYKLDEENYYYSLIYHMIIHKNVFSDNYQSILKSINKTEDYETSLIKFMKNNSYFCSCPLDKYVGQYNINKLAKHVAYKKEFSTFFALLKIRLVKHLRRRKN